MVLDEGGKQRGRFIDSHILPVPENKRDDYLRQARGLAALALEAGALRVVDAWEDDVPHGKVTDFHRATLVRDDERIVFSWIEWPSAEIRDQAWQRLMTDPRMQALMENSAFDGQRVIWGSFETILDS
ncbi:MAG: DUF1428 domain-containing protein [Pigmentiphaga sp.]|nr:DUF1428 domain-containing protein [Pigmentiphaga sp.]